MSAAGLDGVVRVSALELDDIGFGTGLIVVRRTVGGATSLLGLDFAFNGWGGKFPPWTKDAEAAAGILELEGLAREDCRDFVLEGGSVHGDGVGTVLATETCLLNENRNPGLGRDGVERELRRRLGARKVVWLPRGIVWDGDTDGHVDNFACFAGPGRVLLSWCECGEGPGVCAQCSSCEEAEAVLERETDADGPCSTSRGFRWQRSRDTRGEAAAIEGGSRAPGEPLCCSYLNFYVSNAAVVMPGFGCPRSDARAGRSWREPSLREGRSSSSGLEGPSLWAGETYTVSRCKSPSSEHITSITGLLLLARASSSPRSPCSSFPLPALKHRLMSVHVDRMFAVLT